MYVIKCTAKAPELGVENGGQTFFINGKDLITISGTRKWVLRLGIR